MAVHQPQNQRQIGPNEYPDHRQRVRTPVKIDGAYIAFHAFCTLFAAAAAILIVLSDLGEFAIPAYAVIAIAYVLTWFAKKSTFTVPRESDDSQQ